MTQTITRKKHSVSFILIMINVVVFLIQMLFPSLNQYFVLTSQNILFQPWRLITHMFMHASFTHLFFNMYALLLFGNLIEQKIGSKRLLGFYFVAGLVAAFAFIGFDHLKLFLGLQNYFGSALGASGAIMGIIGLVIMLLPDLKVLFFFVIPMSMRTAGIIFALIDIIGMFNIHSSVANAAHLGGLIAGLIYGSYLLKKRDKFRSKFSRSYVTNSKSKKSTAMPTSKYSSKVKTSTDPNNVVIELSDEDIDDYLKNGRL